MREATNTELAYAAGVLDSDGWIGVSRSSYGMRIRGDARQPNYSARVRVKQVTPQAVDLLHELFDGYYRREPPSSSGGRPLWSWSVHSAAAARVLKAALPYLRIKRVQAENALEVCRLARTGRRFDVPTIVPGEPLVTPREAAAKLPYSYESICQAVRKGSVPSVRDGRRILIPASFLPVWASRGQTPQRSDEVTAQLEACYQRAKELNRVGV